MGKPPKVLDRPIAWVCRTYEQDGKTELEVVRAGMSRAEIIAEFPPYHSNSDLGFNRKDLVKAMSRNELKRHRARWRHSSAARGYHPRRSGRLRRGGPAGGEG